MMGVGVTAQSSSAASDAEKWMKYKENKRAADDSDSDDEDGSNGDDKDGSQPPDDSPVRWEKLEFAAKVSKDILVRTGDEVVQNLKDWMKAGYINTDMYVFGSDQLRAHENAQRAAMAKVQFGPPPFKKQKTEHKPRQKVRRICTADWMKIETHKDPGPYTKHILDVIKAQPHDIHNNPTARYMQMDSQEGRGIVKAALYNTMDSDSDSDAEDKTKGYKNNRTGGHPAIFRKFRKQFPHDPEGAKLAAIYGASALEYSTEAAKVITNLALLHAASKDIKKAQMNVFPPNQRRAWHSRVRQLTHEVMAGRERLESAKNETQRIHTMHIKMLIDEGVNEDRAHHIADVFRNSLWAMWVVADQHHHDTTQLNHIFAITEILLSRSSGAGAKKEIDAISAIVENRLNKAAEYGEWRHTLFTTMKSKGDAKKIVENNDITKLLNAFNTKLNLEITKETRTETKKTAKDASSGGTKSDRNGGGSSSKRDRDGGSRRRRDYDDHHGDDRRDRRDRRSGRDRRDRKDRRDRGDTAPGARCDFDENCTRGEKCHFAHPVRDWLRQREKEKK